jgi:hypothetical protein
LGYRVGDGGVRPAEPPDAAQIAGPQRQAK